MAPDRLSLVSLLGIHLLSSCAVAPSSTDEANRESAHSPALELVLLTEWSASSPLTPFVSLDGNDPTPESLQRLRSTLPLLSPASAWTADGSGCLIEIAVIAMGHDHSLEVRYTEYCGALAAESWHYVVACTLGSWHVVSRKLEWIA